MAIDYSRIHRLLKILTLIQSGNGWTAKRLATECKVVVRTIYRDLEMLEGAGIPYMYDSQKKCYSIGRDFFMPPVQLTLDESLALVALGEHVAGSDQVPFTRAASKAVDKIRGHLPPMMRDELDKITRHVAIKLSPVNPPEGTEDVYEKVRKALSEKRMLQCAYESVSSNGKVTGNGPFLFKPYTLFFSQRAWYVVGHHGGRNEIRCLKLNRFSDLKVTSTVYEIPKSFSLTKHLGNAWRMIRGRKAYDVEVVFDKSFAETVEDTHWHPTQQTEWQDDGSMIFRCKVDGLEEIVWWVMSMGPHCRVNKPKELAQQVLEMSQRMMQLYADPVVA